MPTFDLAAMSATTVRPLVVAIAHLPIIFVAVCLAPVWILAAVRPQTHSEIAMRLLCELRLWSRDAVCAASGQRIR